MRYTTALLFTLVAIHATAAPLTVERIFGAPDLSGPRLREPKFSPDGRYVTFLQAKQDNKDQLDLWAFDTGTGKSRLLVDSRALVRGEEKLSAEEEARRERQRTASLRGIVEYQFTADGSRLLIPLGGDLYLYELNASGNPVTRLTNSASAETDARFSPGGHYVSFIRDQNLYVIDLSTRQERAVTTDGRGLVQNGVAEFIAQEEMDRDTGYWWSPDDSRIAFTVSDDSSVQEVERYEINADGARTYRQRYPAAGTPNTRLALFVVELASGKVLQIDPRLGDEDYLARVDWFPDSRHLAVQRQSRNQKQLDLLKVDAASGRGQVLFTETSANWIELNNDLQFLKKRPAFVWSSRRSGYKHLYLYDFDGKLLRPLTAGEWMVVGAGVETGVVGVDEKHGNVYFLANKDSTLERQLYVTSLDTRKPDAPQRISREAGWHEVKLLPEARGYLDLFSSPDDPPNASLHKLDGSLDHWLIRNALDAIHPYHEFLDAHVKEEFGAIPAGDGQQLNYRLTRPAGLQPGKRYPVVVDVYGGPHNQYVKKEWMGGGFFREILAQHGYVVFTLDNRGSGFRGDKFETAIAGRLGKVEVADQVRGVEFLNTQAFVDPQRIGIMGWSYGGFMTLKALTTTEAFKAGVAGAPVTDWRLYDTHYTERYLGLPQTNATGYKTSGVIANAGALKAKLLLVHGMADDNVLFTNSTMMMQALQAQGKPFDVMTYPGSKHGLVRMPVQGRHFYEMVLRFFDREL